MTRPDPRPRKDNSCAHCRKPRKRPEKLNYATAQDFERDSFCSAECCRAWHGVTYDADVRARDRDEEAA
jgi:hypothetical protein